MLDSASAPMVKRKRADGFENGHARLTKRSRVTKHHLMNFTDEVLLRTLSFLDVVDLILVQRSSQRLQRLANDNSIWRERYYERWVHPRARRISGKKVKDDSPSLRYSSKLFRSMNYTQTLREDEGLNWKRQYMIRANWWQGRCKIQELDVASPPSPQVLVKIHKGFIITADGKHGLRVWSRNPRKEALSTRLLLVNTVNRTPTALAVDAVGSKQLKIVVGFSNGSFDILCYTIGGEIQILYSHTPPLQVTISACAISFPYILTMSDGKEVSLHQISATEDASVAQDDRYDLLTSLRSEAVYSPASLSIRRSAAGLVACVAYAFCQLNLGWSLGLQELTLSQQGDLLDCRLAATLENSKSNTKEIATFSEVQTSTRSAFSQTFTLHPHLMSRPSSISYSHPYLTASLPDNTLMVYLVNSNASSLEINAGRRLWGHTSSVAGVEVDARGKAVSISTRGNEIRVWELEDILGSTSLKRSSIRIDPVQNLSIITGAITRRGNGLGIAVRGIQDDFAITRRWVGFDDEQVVVLGEEPSNRQILSCYDFT